MTQHELALVAVYLRVSSDDQRDRETIKTQRQSIERFLAGNPQFQVYRWYEDDGVSGTIPMAIRPQGSALVTDAKAARFSKIVVLRASRLGRDEIDLLTVYNLFVDLLGIELVGVAEPLGDRTMFGFQSIMAGYARRQFLADSARGMDRAARDGRYTGGIVALGYRVEGTKQTARLIPDETLFWQDWSAAQVVRRIYEWLAVENKSCRWIAHQLNLLGVPTAYDRAGRGVRGERTQGLWRPGRIRNLVVNSIYKGTLSYGRRRSKNSKRTEVIDASVPPLVTSEVWEAAQRTMAANRICAKNTQKVYLLRSVMVCGICGLHYGGTPGRDGISWYRCNGQLAERGKIEGRCPSRAVRSNWLEPIVWDEVEGWLRNPGRVLDQLDPDLERAAQEAVATSDRIAVQRALGKVEERRKNAIALRLRERIDDVELDEILVEADRDRVALQARLHGLAAQWQDYKEPLSEGLLDAIRERLDDGLEEAHRLEIVSLLVKRILVETGLEGKKTLRLTIEYRFNGVPPTCNGTGSYQNYTNLKRVVYL